MIVLDCETAKTTYESLSQILKMQPYDIRKFLRSLDWDTDNEFSDKYNGSVERWLLGKLYDKGITPSTFDGVYWFHATRALTSSTFEEGLLPLGEILERIWELLASLISNDELTPEDWRAFKRHVETYRNPHGASCEYQYQFKVGSNQQWGPFGMLVCELIFSPRTAGINDYLRVPEIVEDICMCFENKFEIDLLARYRQLTKPCIVKFINYEAKNFMVGVALYYLYMKCHKLKLTSHNSTNYDGRGNKILPEQIVKVEFF